MSLELKNKAAENQHADIDCYKPDDEMFAVIVHGIVPEFMPYRAFRREKHYKTAGKKIIKCPFCRETFTVVDATAKLELIRYPRRVKDKVKCHDSMPCEKCHRWVGVIYLAA